MSQTKEQKIMIIWALEQQKNLTADKAAKTHIIEEYKKLVDQIVQMELLIEQLKGDL